jgi:hypothetical protein
MPRPPALHASLQPNGQYVPSLQDAHAAILSPNTGVIASDRIPVSVPALLATYSKPTPLADKLQHHIQEQASKHVHRALLASFTRNAQRAALISASAPHAGIPLAFLMLIIQDIA